ncbi:MAG TPA: hypothetical protein VN083_00170 [Vicinamibacteria bacterium]|nr:hypothetical protein [Vicinamibacteria bacterium]
MSHNPFGLLVTQPFGLVVRDNPWMESTFTLVVFGAVALFLVVGVLSMLTNSNLYDQIGEGGLSIGDDHGHLPPGPPANSPAALSEREQEIRQMLQARSDRLVRRGLPELDIDAEVSKLTRPQTDEHSRAAGSKVHDPGLAEEVRQLVVARNERRLRQGLEALDVEAEVERTLQELDP